MTSAAPTVTEGDRASARRTRHRPRRLMSSSDRTPSVLFVCNQKTAASLQDLNSFSQNSTRAVPQVSYAERVLSITDGSKRRV